MKLSQANTFQISIEHTIEEDEFSSLQKEMASICVMCTNFGYAEDMALQYIADTKLKDARVIGIARLTNGIIRVILE